MRRVTRLLILTGVFSTLAACASQGPATSTSVAATSTSSSGHVIPTGYSREVINGSEMFCRDDTNTGSRVQRTKVCVTWEQLQAQERGKITTINQRTSPDD